MVGELLYFKVILDFPGSTYKKGEVITVYKNSGMAYVVSIGDFSEKHDVRDYPDIFLLVEN